MELTCGKCLFCHLVPEKKDEEKKEDEFMCSGWGPKALLNPDGSVRGVLPPILPTWPACSIFKHAEEAKREKR